MFNNDLLGILPAHADIIFLRIIFGLCLINSKTNIINNY